MNNILIIGASGYVGARLSLLLAKAGKNVTALCFPNIPNDKDWCSIMKKVIVGDITSEKVIDELTNQTFDVVIHLVSLDHHESNRTPAFVNSINVMPVWNLLESFKIKKTFKTIPSAQRDPRGLKSIINLSDCLMSGLAIFGMKYSSLLQFDQEQNEETAKYNLEKLYGVKKSSL